MTMQGLEAPGHRGRGRWRESEVLMECHCGMAGWVPAWRIPTFL